MAGRARSRGRPGKPGAVGQRAYGRGLSPGGAPDEPGWQQDLADGLRGFRLILPPDAVSRLARYGVELLRWRQRINLTGFRSPRAIVRYGFRGSLICLTALRPGDLELLDIGSGAGFPGLPLALVRSDLHLTLIEANRRRHSFLSHVCRALSLRNVRCLHGRAEALALDPGLRGRFDVAFARAVRPLEGAASLAAPFLRQGGIFVSQAGLLPAVPPTIPGFGAAQSVPLPPEVEGVVRPLGLLIYPRSPGGTFHGKHDGETTAES
jgi:16S rRNA (guanine527-N7)-methyltransferase